jgi:hypothetical protein
VYWLTIQPHALFFRFRRGRLADIARDIYFETSVIPMESMIRFGDGWYQDEFNAQRDHAWRWMRRESVTLFPPLGTLSVLRFHFSVPLDNLPHPPKMTVTWNGAVIDESVCATAEIDRRFVVASRTGSPDECRISLDEVAVVKSDPREFGLMLTSISWKPLSRETSTPPAHP